MHSLHGDNSWLIVKETEEICFCPKLFFLSHTSALGSSLNYLSSYDIDIQYFSVPAIHLMFLQDTEKKKSGSVSGKTVKKLSYFPRNSST